MVGFIVYACVEFVLCDFVRGMAHLPPPTHHTTPTLPFPYLRPSPFRLCHTCHGCGTELLHRTYLRGYTSRVAVFYWRWRDGRVWHWLTRRVLKRGLREQRQAVTAAEGHERRQDGRAWRGGRGDVLVAGGDIACAASLPTLHRYASSACRLVGWTVGWLGRRWRHSVFAPVAPSPFAAAFCAAR